MQKLSWWRALWLSFFSKVLYQEVVKQWRGYGAAYLLIVSALVVMPIALQIRDVVQSFISDELPLYLDDIPEITITNGIASTPEDHPYIINEQGSKDPFIVIDTTGQYTDIDQTSAPVLITDQQIFIRNDIQTKTMSFSSFGNMTIDRPLIEEFIAMSNHMLIPMIYVILVFFAWSWRLMQAMIYAFLASWIARRKGFTMRYNGFVRLSVVALTPAMLIDMFFGILNISVPFAGVLFVVLEIMYVRFAVLSVSEMPRTKDDNDDGNSSMMA